MRNGDLSKSGSKVLEGDRKCSVGSNGFWSTVEVERKGWGSREGQVVGTLE